MVRKIEWSLLAKEQKREILQYWISRNKSNTYSKKLNRLINEALILIQKYPRIGRRTANDKNLRVKLVKEYLIIYEVTDSTIYIHFIWDGLQDPKKLEKLLE